MNKEKLEKVQYDELLDGSDQVAILAEIALQLQEHNRVLAKIAKRLYFMECTYREANDMFIQCSDEKVEI